MDFLDKLYESNYFGIGLFIVISFLVVAFLVVLFFGKKDEQKRKLEETLKLDVQNANQNAFKETSVKTPVQVPDPSSVVPPVTPLPIEENNVSFEASNTNTPVFPTPIINEDKGQANEPVRPIFEPIKNEIPIINMSTVEKPIVKEESYVEPKVLEPVKYDIPVTPKIEEVKPIVTPLESVVNMSEEKPVEVKSPTIDFDAIAKSISKELDELENTAKYKEEVNVTPMKTEATSKPVNQFSSVYVSEPVSVPKETPVDLPQKIDLPTRKTEDIEPESYNI